MLSLVNNEDTGSMAQKDYNPHEQTCLEEMVPERNNTNKGLHQTCCKFGDIEIQQHGSCEGPW